MNNRGPRMNPAALSSNGKLFKGLRIDAHELLPPREIVLKLRKALIAYVIIIQFTNLNVMVNCDKSLS